MFKFRRSSLFFNTDTINIHIPIIKDLYIVLLQNVMKMRGMCCCEIEVEAALRTEHELSQENAFAEPYVKASLALAQPAVLDAVRRAAEGTARPAQPCNAAARTVYEMLWPTDNALSAALPLPAELHESDLGLTSVDPAPQQLEQAS